MAGQAMLPKKNRADTNEIDRIFKEGSSLNSPSLTFRYLKNAGATTNISFIAPKSVAKLAVKRNLLRRLGYNAIEKHINRFPPLLTGVFIFKKYNDDVLILENEIKNILSKIN